MSRVKKFDLTYEALNENNTFSEGDTVSGRVNLTLAKETKVKSLIVKLKGEARVLWNEKVGNQTITRTAHKTYFKVSEMLVAENENGIKLHTYYISHCDDGCVVYLWMLHHPHQAVMSPVMTASLAGTVLPAGVHDLKFTFKIPDE